MAAGKKRIAVVANKWWECNPILNVLLNSEAHANPEKPLPWPTFLNHPRRRREEATTPAPRPLARAVFELTNVDVDIWCISDLLEDLSTDPCDQSSSERKAERLPGIFGTADYDLVIAMGTAGFPAEVTENGCAVVGTGIFMHDCHPIGNEDPASKWHVGPFDRLIPSVLDRELFDKFTKVGAGVESRLMLPPNNPSWKPRMLAAHSHVALGAVNVWRYDEYDTTDEATIAAFKKTDSMGRMMSLETTHGLIRAQSDAPFMFISGITDRVGHFHDEVSSRKYVQNEVAAHNAGVVLAWMLPNMDLAYATAM